MKAIAVFPGKSNTVHLAEMPKPSLDEVPNGRGVLVKVLRVGVDGTDKEINAADYGKAPRGRDCRVMPHESLRQLEAPRSHAGERKPAAYVLATHRHPGSSL